MKKFDVKKWFEDHKDELTVARDMVFAFVEGSMIGIGLAVTGIEVYKLLRYGKEQNYMLEIGNDLNTDETILTMRRASRSEKHFSTYFDRQKYRLSPDMARFTIDGLSESLEKIEAKSK